MFNYLTIPMVLTITKFIYQIPIQIIFDGFNQFWAKFPFKCTFTSLGQVFSLTHRVSIFSNISVILISTWAWCAQVKHLVYRNPQTVFFGILLRYSLLNIKMVYIFFAISKLRFI